MQYVFSKSFLTSISQLALPTFSFPPQACDKGPLNGPQVPVSDLRAQAAGGQAEEAHGAGPRGGQARVQALREEVKVARRARHPHANSHRRNAIQV